VGKLFGYSFSPPTPTRLAAALTTAGGTTATAGDPPADPIGALIAVFISNGTRRRIPARG